MPRSPGIVNQHDKHLICELKQWRKNAFDELKQLEERQKEIRKTLKNVTDAKIAKKFEISLGYARRIGI